MGIKLALALGSDIRSIFLTHGLLHIESDSPVTLREFQTLTKKLGRPMATIKHVLSEDSTVQELSNDGLFGTDDVDWHNDWSYGRGNFFGTILCNRRNGHLAPTEFCDMKNAPEELFDLYSGEVGRYSPPVDLHEKCFTPKQLRILEKQAVTRPFEIEHITTGERLFYCSLATIRDCERDLTPVRDWVEENKFTWDWKENDILVWDNLRMIHRRPAFTGDRLLWRSQFDYS